MIAKDLLTQLRRHYVPRPDQPAGIFAPEIGAPSGTRRADLIWQGTAVASGLELVGHEIKVSRADVLAELADPAKTDPWQRFCDRWWLVVPSTTLLDGLELPATWGVLTPPSGRRTRSMTIARPAPALHPVDQSPAVRTLATWLMWRHLHATHTIAGLEKTVETQREQLMQAREPAPPATPRDRVLDEIVTRLGGIHGGSLGDWHTRVDVDDVVAAITDATRLREHTRRGQSQLEGVHHRLAHLRASIDHVLADAGQRPAGADS